MERSRGSYGSFEIEITVGTDKLPDLRADEIRAAGYKAADMIRTAVMAAVVQMSPEAHERSKLERSELLGLFSERIFVEEIPNGYCSQWCCRHLPWFIVTTKIGRFKIGWRKRVINIDWTDTVGTKPAHELFPSENVTKWDRGIHAWNVEDAARYIKAITDSADGQTP